MPLPQFNGQATGPQGISGIHPDEIARAQAQVGAGPQPDESAAAQQILDHEAGSIAEQLGVVRPVEQEEPASEPRRRTQPSEAETASGAQSAEPVREESEEPQEGDDDPIRSRIRAIRKETGGDYLKLAELYAREREKREQSDVERRTLNAERAELEAQRREIEALKRQYDNLTVPDRDPGYRAQRGPERYGPDSREPVGDPQPEVSEEMFWQKPVEVIGQVVSSHMTAAMEALRRQQEKDRQIDAQRQYLAQHKSELDTYRSEMNDLYAMEPDVYNQMPAHVATNLLLRQAKDRVTAREAKAQAENIAAAFKEISDLAEGGPLPVAGPQRGASGAVPMPGSGSAARRAGTSPRKNWSQTNTFKRLWRTGDGSVDETLAVADILREREFGEHIK